MTDYYIPTSAHPGAAWVTHGLKWLIATGNVTDEMKARLKELDDCRAKLPSAPPDDEVREAIMRDPQDVPMLGYALYRANSARDGQFPQHWDMMRRWLEEACVRKLNMATLDAIQATRDARREDLRTRLEPALSTLNELGSQLPPSEYRYPTTIATRERGAAFHVALDQLRPLWNAALAEGITFERSHTGHEVRNMQAELWLGESAPVVIRHDDHNGHTTEAQTDQGEEVVFV